MKRLSMIVVTLVFLGLIASSVSASPIVELVTYRQFAEALEKGLISPITEWNNALESHYPGKKEHLRKPELKVLEGIKERVPEPGLLMVWGEPRERVPVIAGWEYKLAEDPNLKGTVIKLSIYPPFGMTSVDFEIVDSKGRIKGWDWRVGFDKCMLVPGVQHTFYIIPEAGACQAGATSYYEDRGFDVTQVVKFQFTEEGRAVAGIPVPETREEKVWNYWKNIRVIPMERLKR